MNKLLLPVRYCVILISVYSFLAVLHGCGADRSIYSAKEYIAYINDPANGLVQAREVNGIKFTAKFLPPDYLAFLELSKAGAGLGAMDSLSGFYSGSTTFQLVVESANPAVELRQLIHKNASSQSELTEQLNILNHGMGDHLKLTFGDKETAPVLSILESTLEGDRKLSFLLVFDVSPALPSASGESPAARLSLGENFFLDSETSFDFEANALSGIKKLQVKN